MLPSLTDPYALRVYDLPLFAELAEHAVLIANGWKWDLMDDIAGQPVLVWKAPDYHRGSARVYKHRQHAYNSHMKWNHPLLYPTVTLAQLGRGA